MTQPALHIGSHTLRVKLAVGGYCNVWLSAQRAPMGFRRWCALKVLKDEYVGDDAMERALMMEARLVASLQHPNLISLLEFGHDPGTRQVYYTMPYIQGRSLSTVVQWGALSPAARFGVPEAYWLGARILDALGHLHAAVDEQGRPMHAVHRDVSPENVLLSHEGQIYVIDFGIAISSMFSRQTHFRRIKGKPQYLSPEQARGEDRLDRRTDIYATGLLMFLMLTGREAYSSDPMTALSQARHPSIPPLEAITDLPAELTGPINAMLHPSANHRPNDASALARHMRALLRKYYPHYDAWNFRENIQGLMMRAKREDRDMLASLASGTKVIREQPEDSPSSTPSRVPGRHPTRPIDTMPDRTSARSNTWITGGAHDDEATRERPIPAFEGEPTAPFSDEHERTQIVPASAVSSDTTTTTEEVPINPRIKAPMGHPSTNKPPRTDSHKK